MPLLTNYQSLTDWTSSHSCLSPLPLSLLFIYSLTRRCSLIQNHYNTPKPNSSLSSHLYPSAGTTIMQVARCLFRLLGSDNLRYKSFLNLKLRKAEAVWLPARTEHKIKQIWVHKRQSRSSFKEDVDSLKSKPVEEILAESKKRKSTQYDNVASAGLKIVEPEGHSLSEETPEEEEEDKDGDESSEGDESNKQKENSRRHVRHGSYMVRGKMEHSMEDYVVTKKHTVDGKELGLYAIFDGHSGPNVAEYLQNHLFDSILSQPDFWSNPEAAVKRAYKTTDEEILDKVAGSRGGSTAVTAILINKEKLIVANVGDSRAVLCKRKDIEQITVDHEPEKEKDLVERNVARVDGQLAMSRAFGDGKVKEHITSEPDVRIESVDIDAKFVILASDGLWKVMSNEDASKCIEEMDDPKEAAEELVKEALQRGTSDDISCVVVAFHH